jgi:hypothetical protein
MKKMTWTRVGWVSAWLSVGVPAAAAPHDGQSTDSIYSEARAALDRADYAKACPLLREYYDRDPTPAALFAMAECEARWGKNVEAVTHFEAFLRRTDAAPSALQDQRTRHAYEQVSKLQMFVGRVTPVLGSDQTGPVEIKLDGTLIQPGAEFPLVVAPGAHVFAIATSEGRREVPFQIEGGEVRKIELLPSAQPAPPSARATVGGAPADKPKVPPKERLGLTPFLVAGGIGVAGTVAGGVLGALAWGQKSEIDRHCVLEVCDHQGKIAADHAQTFAGVSTAMFVVGALGLASAATLYFLEKDGGQARVVKVLREAGRF